MAGTLAAGPPAAAEQFVNAASKFCLDTDGAAKNGGQVRMWQCADHPNQIWTVKKIGFNQFQLVNGTSKFCLDTDGAAKDGGQVRMWQCANHPNQIWDITTLSGDRYRIRNKASGYCLDTDGRAVNGGQVRMWQCVTHNNQTWSVLGAGQSGPQAKGTNPGPLGRGVAEGPLNGKSFASFPVCATNAPKPVLEVLNLLNQVAGKFGASVTKDFRCGFYKREIATGVTLQPPVHPSWAQPRWDHLGGRGRQMAEAMVCLMKDIGNLPGGRFTRVVPVPVGIGKVELRQTVGLSEFNAAARRAKLYQVMRICAPLLGCLDAQRQDITAAVRESVPAWPSGYKLLDYPIANSYSVEVGADWSYTKLGATLPPITIITPYGQVSAKPGFTYSSSLYPVDTPFSFKGGARHPFHYAGAFGNGVTNVLLQDTYGRSGIPFILNVIANIPQAMEQRPANLPPGTIWVPKAIDPLKAQGWVSQLGLGARDGAYDAKVWTPSAGDKYPLRGDFDMTQARSQLEKAPSANFVAEAPIRFKPPDPLSLLPGAVRDIISGIELWIDINPRFAADYAAQLALLAREGKMLNGCGTGKEFGATCGMTETGLVAQANAQGRVEIVGNIHLKISFISFGPFEVDPVELDKPFKIPLPSPSRKWDPNPAIKTVQDAHQRAAWAGSVAISGPDAVAWQFVRGFSGMTTSNIAQWTEQCLKTPPKTVSPPPPPSHEPGKADELTPDLLPCNICVADHNQNKYKPFRLFPVAARKPGIASWKCEAKANLGCHDMCSWNKQTGQWIRAEVSAVDIDGARCTQGVPVVPH